MTIHDDFPDWNSFVDACATRAPAGSWVTQVTTRGSDDDPRPWNGSTTFAQAIDLARTGWTAGRADLSAAVTALAASADARPRWTWTLEPAGARPLVPAALAGAPAAMMQFRRSLTQAPVLHIKVESFVSCGVNASAVIARGAALCALIDSIEHQGIRVELTLWGDWSGWSGKTRKDMNTRHLCTVRLKAPDEPLDMDRIAFALGHPACQRRLVFRLQETHARLYTMFHETYGGYPGIHKDPDAVVIPIIDMADNDLSTAEWLTKLTALVEAHHAEP